MAACARLGTDQQHCAPHPLPLQAHHLHRLTELRSSARFEKARTDCSALCNVLTSLCAAITALNAVPSLPNWLRAVPGWQAALRTMHGMPMLLRDSQTLRNCTLKNRFI